MEQRLAIYKSIQEVIAEVMRTGKSDDNIFRRYLQATDQIPYLFGPEVETYLDRMRGHLADLQLGNDLMSDRTNPEYQKGVEIKHRAFKAVVLFYEEAKPIFGPYIRAHQRADA
jgi:hypothetical protein